MSLKDEVFKDFKNARLFPENKKGEFEKTITKVTHENKNENHGILFEDENNKTIYISGMNTLSWGIYLPEKKWLDFKDERLVEIIFSDFTTENTFRLIDSKCRYQTIQKILSEILEEKRIGYKNLVSE